jgi:heme-degrading monooxygenase HmoA
MARTPDTPADYWAVIFTAQRTETDEDAYEATAQRMAELGSAMPGFLGLESARDTEGLGVTVSYWETLEHVLAWKAVGEHQRAQAMGRSDWYSSYTTRVAHVVREYSFVSEK